MVPLFWTFIGALVGFLCTIAYTWHIRRSEEWNFKVALLPYIGKYSSCLKNKAPSNILEVELSHIHKDILMIKFKTKSNGPAEGIVKVEPYVLKSQVIVKSGIAYYNHTDEDQRHKSGYYNMLFLKPGEIHATVYYMKDATEIRVTEIWTKL